MHYRHSTKIGLQLLAIGLKSLCVCVEMWNVELFCRSRYNAPKGPSRKWEKNNLSALKRASLNLFIAAPISTMKHLMWSTEEILTYDSKSPWWSWLLLRRDILYSALGLNFRRVAVVGVVADVAVVVRRIVFRRVGGGIVGQAWRQVAVAIWQRWPQVFAYF